MNIACKAITWQPAGVGRPLRHVAHTGSLSCAMHVFSGMLSSIGASHEELFNLMGGYLWRELHYFEGTSLTVMNARFCIISEISVFDGAYSSVIKRGNLSPAVTRKRSA